jgi:hypothetical protein
MIIKRPKYLRFAACDCVDVSTAAFASTASTTSLAAVPMVSAAATAIAEWTKNKRKTLTANSISVLI